ncbi:MptD family putative ECF transporter S component [Xiamenia xianingshaonis]|uniref:MptD family putative ECF transporter S component n=1 Tax=Xiamenia xianingshaonis TaxID=2682776 RepID=UPI0028F70EB7|nr:MptD family putative ECF transporter S component [Xiamenia xianingshaonis]
MAKIKVGGNTKNAQENAASSKKLRTRDLIYAGAFGAIYLVVMLIIVMASGMIPVLYLAVPLTVGAVCGTIYEMCVLKVRKFGAALILGILFALVACTSEGFVSIVPAIAAAVLAELIIFLGKYKSKFMYLLSFIVFNLNMACPFIGLQVARDEFLARCVEFYGQDYANQLAALAPDWIVLVEIGLAIAGGIIGAFIASKLIKKHFQTAGVM